MTDSQQPETNSTHRKVLEGAFSPAIVDAIDGRIQESLAKAKDELTQLIDEHKRTIAEVRAMPASPEREAAKQAADETTGQLSAAVGELNGVIEGVKAGQPVEPEKVEKVAKFVDKAEEAVKETSEEVSRQLADLTEKVNNHDAILDGSHDGVRPLSRLDTIEERLDSMELCLEEHQGVIASAFAYARASISGDNIMRRAAQVGLGVFAVAFLVCCLVVLITPIEWAWLPVIGLSAIAAGIAAAIVFLRSDNGVEVMSYADAATIVAADRRRAQDEDSRQQRSDSSERRRPAIFADDPHDEDHQHDGHHTGASASAMARAGTR